MRTSFLLARTSMAGLHQSKQSCYWNPLTWPAEVTTLHEVLPTRVRGRREWRCWRPTCAGVNPSGLLARRRQLPALSTPIDVAILSVRRWELLRILPARVDVRRTCRGVTKSRYLTFGRYELNENENCEKFRRRLFVKNQFIIHILIVCTYTHYEDWWALMHWW